MGPRSLLAFTDLKIQEHEGITVVRDDLFPYGSKARFLWWYFDALKKKGVEEVVYGSSPRWGYAQVSIAWLASQFGMKFSLFIAKSKVLHPYTQRAKQMGCRVVQVPMGFLNVTESRARKYAEKIGAHLLPIGLDVPEALEGIVKVGQGVRQTVGVPDEVWTVASSGTLQRGLQALWPESHVKFYAVRVGQQITSEQVGRAIIVDSCMKFQQKVRGEFLPPFPSVPEYDAKAWRFIPKDGKKLRLFWNVGG